MAWQDRAACKFTGWVLFYGPDGERAPEREVREAAAKEMCASCVVLDECREFALSNRERHGWWGGMGEDERESVRRKRLRQAAKAGEAA
jgi:WhiB family redox-sensing transcriptional regulator